MDPKVYLNYSFSPSLQEVLLQAQPKRILLVTGQTSFESSGAAAICTKLFEGYDVRRFSDFSPNPNIDEVRRGVRFVQELNPDLVVAVGGGSAIDVAKAINVLAVQPLRDIDAYIESRAKIEQKGAMLVAVPTTAGTGSEATHFAVVYIGTKKYSLAHEFILPDVAIVDPELTVTMSPYQTAVTGLDALSQAMEAMWSIKATEESISYSREALPMILANLQDAVHRPTRESREKMAIGAHLAGKAINIAKTTASHAMSYALTMHFGIPHGHAVAVTLPELLEFNGGVSVQDAEHPLGAEYVRKIIEEICGMLGASDVKEAKNKLQSYVESLDIKTSLSSFGVTQADVENLVEEMSVERAGNNPRTFTKADAVCIITSII